MPAAAFDADRFAKVRVLHDRTDIPGERAAAASRMEAMAKAAGLTLVQALRRLDGGKTAAPRKPRKKAEPQQEERAWSPEWQRVVQEYGSESAVFARGPWEQALVAACARFTIRKKTAGWPIGSLWGWSAISVKDPAPEIVAAVEAAYPMPASVQQAWAEYQYWDKLGRDREARGAGYGDPSAPVALREQLVERLLNTLPARSLNDMRARLSWMEHTNQSGMTPDPETQSALLTALRADFERMASCLKRRSSRTGERI
ncbi:hypothetical protein Q8W71_07275 [Methylobacterium sp. NEAU 140]|uniref:hypothetical protein n=1 Tax=Methylobacterium sp. NEAU 140 TaxID=3064945 RepID=UPI002732C96E|nr:hypothetical protein [Methylobacterium sp. NEAU 140]MDP4022418.1 hypothetical protein [Methylobacterium sp. NEAU 140]